ncbi:MULTISPECIES: hypothetical protein [Methylomonas]|uniref:Terminase n=2 Tax=Methylomonas TaxID=416 RepID=A0A140E5F1_9GAMM|nr:MULTISPECIES: hypothetical protein [Methylomonas]AMK75625.1 hypothetical protein JT25_003840 [Methylomonas denitrificans]OAI08032.1 hypothetical protein A1342_19180 [Methylomonas methanica]TCV72460.1 hypothetical protein EDE11_1526 [Methylomonas methanica]
MAKLTKQQWTDVRRQWEGDPRQGHQWLADELTAQGYDVNRAAIAKAASRQGWAKREPLNVTQNVTQSNKKRDKSSLKNVTPKQVKRTIPEAVPEPEREEVTEVEINQGGRPTKYMPHFDRQAYHLCLLGATDAELAEFFMVTEQTINNWKKVYITFFESAKRGKMLSDSEAAVGLFKRATGFRYEEVKTKQVKVMAEGDGDGGVQAAGDELMVVEVVTTVKEVPPDTGAAFIWLKNRRPKDWRDKIEVENTHKLNPEMMDRIKTEFVERMAMARSRQLSVLAERGLIDERELNADAGGVE